MAEIILTPLLQVIFEKLANPVLQKFADYWELEDRFQKLQKVLPMAQAVIQDAEERQTTDKVIRIWLTQLKDAASKAEDLLEELIVCQGKHSMQYSLNLTKSRNILDDLQKAVVEGFRLPLLESRNNQLDERETSSFVIGSEVCGREEERERIVQKLLISTNEENVPLVSIVGTPGIGKTTLAQMVYNDVEVKKRFDLRIWVFASLDFKAKRMIKAAIESVTGKKCDVNELDVLQCTLWNLLQKRRYLLVLDDVWNEDEEEWDRLRILFASGVEGSRVVITTRSQKVAMLVGSPNYAYHLKGLSEEGSWALFRKRAFSHKEEEGNHQSLVEIGKQIVRKCKGEPLAVKVLGGLLRFKREERDWLHVQNMEHWDLGVYRKRILPALLLSYLHLPSHLKHCFVFCLIFPKDYVFQREKLVHMWMAQGFILPGSGRSPMEDTGNDYFNELLWMSVLEEVNECEGGLVGGYKMNTVYYSLARSITENDFLVLEKGFVRRNLGQVRHASIVSNYAASLIPEALHQAKHLRSLLIFAEGGLPAVPSRIFSNFTYLRMLYLSGCLAKLPESISGNLFLKLLDLSNSHFHELPSAISAIISLEVLNLFGCYNLKRIPPMKDIIGLRHLNISGCEALVEMPDGINHLELLQTLPIYIVPKHPDKMKRRAILQKVEDVLHGGTPGYKTKVLSVGISELKHWNLRGELKIKHLERVNDVEEAKEARLMDKEYLESLGLCWGDAGAEFIMNPALETARFQGRKPSHPGPSEDREPSSPTVCDPDLAWEVLQCIQPPKNLKKLYVVGYPGVVFARWTLPNLTELVLINCRGCLQLPVLGHLPLLRSLHMEGISSIVNVGQEIYGEDAEIPFPSLEELFIKHFPSLREWAIQENKGSFPKLRKAVFDDCPNLVSVPHFASLDRLELRRCSSTVLKCMENSSLLSFLSIEGFDDLIYLPDKLIRNNPSIKCLRISSCPNLCSLSSAFRGLASLASLTIRWCENLTLLPMEFEKLTALEFLEISDCHNVENLPENILGYLTSLQELSIENCSSLTSISFGFQPLTALKHFTIMYSPRLTALPDNFENLPSLTSLAIISCPLIEFLPEGIKTLRSLEIRSCPRLIELPEWIDSLPSLRTFTISDCRNLMSLPVAFGRLTKLQRLTIQDCPQLHRRCRQDRGEDWWKIAHIPYRHIFSSETEPSFATSLA